MKLNDKNFGKIFAEPNLPKSAEPRTEPKFRSFLNSDTVTYNNKCKEISLLPLSKHFEVNDLIFFHKILTKQIDIPLPSYIQYYNGQSRLRNARLYMTL